MAVKKRKGSLYIWKSAKDKMWYWNICSSNGKVMANSTQGYTRKFYLFKTLEALGLMLREVRLKVVEK